MHAAFGGLYATSDILSIFTNACTFFNGYFMSIYVDY